MSLSLKRVVQQVYRMGAMLAGILTMVGCGVSPTGNTVTATPSLSPAGGTFSSSQTVTIADTTNGAVLYCTTDGTTPTTSSPQCGQPTTVFKSEYLQAIAVAPGLAASTVAEAAYTIDLNAAATPAFSPAGGTYTASQTVAIADTTSGANIFYTTDGSVPTASSTLYTGTFAVTQTETISAVAVASGFSNSGVASATYTISPLAATPVFSLASGTYTSAQTVTINDATAGATIYYTTDGSTPTTSSMVYAGPVTVSKTGTLSAVATAPGSSTSPIATASYTINLSAATPAFSPTAGTYTSAQTVAITDATAGATIFYTVDGSTPTTSSTVYAGPVTVSKTETLSAIATAPGSSTSPVATAAYTINLQVASPTFSPQAGAYTSVQTVTISDATAGATIYYTIDGSVPTTSSTLYSGPVTVSATETLSAIATATGLTNSTVATAAYAINLNTTAAPIFAPAAGTYTSAQNVTISDSTSGATIYYSIDGSAPTTSSTLYSGPITVSSTETLKAIAVASGYTTSAAATAVYTISVGNASLNGTVKSGNLPVVGAQVQLYAAGQSGYGSAATALLVSPVATSSNGTFSFNYNCAASPNNLVYLVATGGNTGAGANPGTELMAALGPCADLSASTPIIVNETTTVASVYALSPFITAAPNVGTSATNYQGLSNAFQTVSNLVNIATGDALATTPAYAASPLPFYNASTVPQSRIDTLANLLNGCVNSNGGTCSNLFSAATPASGSVPTNTLQAMIDIAQNPGSNVSALFVLASPTGPFTPVLGAPPADFTLALTFTGAGLGGQTASGGLINSGMAIDASGNVWVTSNQGNEPLEAEFSPIGAPLTPSANSATPGGYAPILGYNFSTSDVIAFDPSGLLWIGGQGSKPSDPTDYWLAEVSPPPFPSLLQTGLAGGSEQYAYTVAIDGTGDVWAGGDGGLVEYGAAGNQLVALTNGAPSAVPNDAYGQLAELAFDSNGNLWGEDNNGFGDFYLISTTNGAIEADPFFNPGGVFSPIAADGTGNMYLCGSIDSSNVGGQSLNVVNASSVSTVTAYPIATGRGCGGQLAIDGLGNIFAITGGTIPGIVDEFSTTGVSISPVSTGYTGTSSGEAVTINPDPSQTMSIVQQSGPNTPSSGVAAAAVDGSGNLWILNPDTGASGGTPGNVLVEFVGIGAPVVTPPSAGLANGTLGKRP